MCQEGKWTFPLVAWSTSKPEPFNAFQHIRLNWLCFLVLLAVKLGKLGSRPDFLLPKVVEAWLQIIASTLGVSQLGLPHWFNRKCCCCQEGHLWANWTVHWHTQARLSVLGILRDFQAISAGLGQLVIQASSAPCDSASWKTFFKITSSALV